MSSLLIGHIAVTTHTEHDIKEHLLREMIGGAFTGAGQEIVQNVSVLSLVIYHTLRSLKSDEQRRHLLEYVHSSFRAVVLGARRNSQQLVFLTSSIFGLIRLHFADEMSSTNNKCITIASPDPESHVTIGLLEQWQEESGSPEINSPMPTSFSPLSTCSAVFEAYMQKLLELCFHLCVENLRDELITLVRNTFYARCVPASRVATPALETSEPAVLLRTSTPKTSGTLKRFFSRSNGTPLVVDPSIHVQSHAAAPSTSLGDVAFRLTSMLSKTLSIFEHHHTPAVLISVALEQLMATADTALLGEMMIPENGLCTIDRALDLKIQLHSVQEWLHDRAKQSAGSNVGNQVSLPQIHQALTLLLLGDKTALMTSSELRNRAFPDLDVSVLHRLISLQQQQCLELTKEEERLPSLEPLLAALAQDCDGAVVGDSIGPSKPQPPPVCISLESPPFIQDEADLISLLPQATSARIFRAMSNHST